ncbi:hemolysin family protein [Isoptericola variabilis]|uniref:CBS domain containing protein n=1 Tax=Isoptericola variabilis (strain 225) TaxID=743718 RepID=F6FXI3_ISOV2|nr:hemolysin family protein [Isoptericola variabilis]AEG44711.1 CBS domain containing protein [Isoptericola variabilis 225]TWH33430.1 CBS domain containing-hemolysin-like protein [Isoptericola variabilis J7]
MNVPDPLLALVALVCLALAGMLSAGEAAVLRVTRASLADARAEAEADDDRPEQARVARVRRVRRAQALAVDPTAAVASFALVRVFAQTVALAAATLLLADWFDEWWRVLAAAAVVGLVAGIVFVRLSPRALGFRSPVRVLLSLAGPLTAVHRLAAWLTRRSAARAPDATASEEELRAMADRVRENEAIEAEDRELIRSVFELGGTLAREVMVPRTDMVTADAATPLRKVMRLFLKSGYSRVPVVGASVDDLLGVAYLKDVARVLENDPDAGDRPVSEVARPPVFVPESKPVDDLLRQMQASRSHIAIVVDEYGGTAGLVTVEDVIEELVGELTDEHDVVQVAEPEALGDGTFRVPARMPVDELGELFDLRLDDDDVDTAGGLLAKAIGKVPLVGSTADVGGLRLVGERVEGRRKQLATILVSRTATEAADDAVVPPDQREHA